MIIQKNFLMYLVKHKQRTSKNNTQLRIIGNMRYVCLSQYFLLVCGPQTLTICINMIICLSPGVILWREAPKILFTCSISISIVVFFFAQEDKLNSEGEWPLRAKSSVFLLWEK